jgi:hypothetical protein
VGLDDNIHPWFAQRRRSEGEVLARGRSIPQCRAFVRGGVPTALRPALWAAALGSGEPGDQRSRGAFDRLCGDVKRRELLTDALVAGQGGC